MRGFGTWTESNWYDDRSEIPCECGAVYPRYSRKVNASSINGKANGCTACKPSRHEQEIARAKMRGMQRLATHIANGRKRIIYRDVAIRYLERFGGQTFGVQTAEDTAEIYLESAKGKVLGAVSYLDKYPKPPPDAVFDDMPF